MVTLQDAAQLAVLLDGTPNLEELHLWCQVPIVHWDIVEEGRHLRRMRKINLVYGGEALSLTYKQLVEPIRQFMAVAPRLQSASDFFYKDAAVRSCPLPAHIAAMLSAICTQAV